MRTALLIILSIFLTFQLDAQIFTQTASRKAQKYFEKSVEAYRTGDFDDAEKNLLKAIEEEPDYVNALIRLGGLYYRQGAYEKGVEYLSKGTSLAPDFSYYAYQVLGKCYLELEEYDKAKAAYEQFLKDPKIPEKKKKQVQQNIDNLLFTSKAKQNPVPFKPQNLGTGINTKDHEYLPTLTAGDEILYFTRREGMLEDIWVSKQKEGKWQEAKNLGEPINYPQFGEGSQAISPDGKSLYFAANWGDGEKIRGWDIYEANKTEKGWTNPEMLPEPINTLGYESQPCISADGKSLYFSSRREGGEGGRDIYVSYRQEDCSWGDPENLGPVVNTEMDEEVPFIHADGKTLYFGTPGHPGMGGSDLFMTRKDDSGNWSKPVNLGYPLNTENNEAALFVSTKGDYGYFASDQLEGEGGFDIYRFELWPDIKPEPVGFVLIRIFDKETNEQLDADFEMINLESGVEILNSKCNEYLKNYFFMPLPLETEFALNVNRPGYLFHSANITLTKTDKFQTKEIDIYLEKLKAGNKLVMKNVFFATDSFELQEKSKPELMKLVKLLKENPSLKIEIGGHTDSIGSSAYNQQLSEKRAKSVHAFLVNRGINAKRLSFKGYGDSQPLDSNKTEEGRAKNRRTEIQIVDN